MQQATILLRRTARKAGWLYLLLGIPGAYSLIYVPSKIIRQKDIAETARNIVSHEFLFRTAIVAQLFSSVVFIFLVLELYKLLNQVNKYQATLMVILVLVQTPIAFLLEVFNITGLMILKGELLQTLTSTQKDDFAMMFLKLHYYGIIILQIFWGLWLLPFGQLVYKSVFIPRLLGVVLIINGVAYIFTSLIFLLLPDYLPMIVKYSFVFFSIGEPAIILWLVIKGVQTGPRLKD